MSTIAAALHMYNMGGLLRRREDTHVEEVSKAIREPYQDPAPQRTTQLSDGLCPFESLMNSHAYLTDEGVRTAVRLALQHEVSTFGDAPEGSLLAVLLAAFDVE